MLPWTPLNKWTNWDQEKWLFQGNKVSQEQSWITHFHLPTSSSSLFPWNLVPVIQQSRLHRNCAPTDGSVHCMFFGMISRWISLPASKYLHWGSGVRGHLQNGSFNSNRELCKSNTPHSSSGVVASGGPREPFTGRIWIPILRVWNGYTEWWKGRKTHLFRKYLVLDSMLGKADESWGFGDLHVGSNPSSTNY